MRKSIFLAVFSAIFLLTGGYASAQETVTFQQGVDDYDGFFDIIIGRNSPDDITGLDVDLEFGESNVLGSNVEHYFLDGAGGDLYERIDEKQALMRFDGVEETIPEGARILSATLELTTTEEEFANTGGAYGVSQLLVPFDQNTTYNSVNDGMRFGDNDEATRPLPNGFGSADFGVTVGTDITPFVQAWVDGEPNHGVSVTASTSNGWSIFFSGATEVTVRPKLTVVYTMDPAEEGSFEETVITQSTEDVSTSNFRISEADDTWTDEDSGNPLGEFLDGNGGAQEAMLRFDNLFESQGGSIPDSATIHKATLVVTTASFERSSNSGTGGQYGVRQVTSAWNTDSVYADLTFSDFIDNEGALMADSEASYDVTSVVQAWQSGGPNHGLNVADNGTTDGWAMLFSSASEGAPKLVIQWTDVVLGDANGDGNLDNGDIAPFVLALLDPVAYAADFPDVDVDVVLDLNGDGGFDNGDLAVFVAALLG